MEEVNDRKAVSLIKQEKISNQKVIKDISFLVKDMVKDDKICHK